jgi:hypothetical protein
MRRTFVVCNGLGEFRTWCSANTISPHSPLVRYIPRGCARQLLEGTIDPVVEYTGHYTARDDLHEVAEMALSRQLHSFSQGERQ